MRLHPAALLAFTLTICALALSAAPVHGAPPASTPATQEEAAIGRWDITLQTPAGALPSWLEIRRSGSRTLVGRFVGTTGSARPISRIEVKDGELRFAIPTQWENGTGDLVFAGRVQGGAMTGVVTLPDGTRHELSAVRAPSLQRPAPVRWGQPIRLFNGRDLSGWRALGESRWEVADGVLRNTGGGANLVTERSFTDFKLHVELRLPAGSNSGVYLRGRYEVQIADALGEPPSNGLGAVYGFIAPLEAAGKAAGEWQALDITLVGRRITLVVNDRTVICDQEIPGITGGALDSDEGTPGPLLLQGDHGAVEFRNLQLTPAR
jgi:3-keto-disaccharide hydrolase